MNGIYTFRIQTFYLNTQLKQFTCFQSSINFKSTFSNFIKYNISTNYSNSNVVPALVDHQLTLIVPLNGRQRISRELAVEKRLLILHDHQILWLHHWLRKTLIYRGRSMPFITQWERTTLIIVPVVQLHTKHNEKDAYL